MAVEKLIRNIDAYAKQYTKNFENYGLRYAHWVLWGDLAGRLGLGKLSSRMKEKKKKYILHHLDETAQHIFEYDVQKKMPDNRPRIWMFWWTGIDDAPDIVKISVNSVRAHANQFEVCVLDRDNYQDYVGLPEHIIEKHDRGLITHAMFSDILRITLLSLYGGVWIDATVLCLRELPEFLKTIEFYSGKAYDIRSTHVSKSRWTSYFLAGSADFRLLREARNLLYTYWHLYDIQIDYLLIDYVLEYIRIKDPYVRRTMNRLPDNNLKRNEMFGSLNEPYSEELLMKFRDDETFIYKCSWRYGTFAETDENGIMTFYGFLKDRYLDNC